ncbi:MAG TPA: FAD-dependent oxidoreductase [Armatimonadota bacterium]|jgi:2-polyprenyl-6-methoxyphenol hydroxylase-like FAD-dependent oxidoreductase
MIEEPARATPVAAEVDVLVVGGGTAGVTAALAAAQAGCRVLVLEELSLLGGTQTGALVTPMMRNHLGEEPLTRGLNEAILARTAELFPWPTKSPNDRLWFDPVALSMALDDLLAEPGVDVRFETRCSSALVRDGSMAGVVAESPGGRTAYLAKVVIDCTGDADVAVLAGAPYSEGDEEGRNQPMSLRFTLAGVMIDRAAEGFAARGVACEPPLLHVGFHEASTSPIADLVAQAEAEGTLERGDLGYFQFFSMLGRPGELAFNCPRLTGYRPTDVADRSRALRDGRRKVRRIAAFCRRHLPGFEESYLASVASMLGVRESRRILGDYVLTQEDVLSGARFGDGIARNNYPIDIHHTRGRGTTLKQLPDGEYHDIPYRCLLPQRVEQLLVAGRCLSATFEAQAAARIQANCRAMGEAAGTAAALALERGTTVRGLDTEELRARLRARGAEV